MATALTIATKFTVVDKFSSAMRKMANSTKTFKNKAVSAFHRIERAERKVRKGMQKMLGTVGQLGLGFTGLMIAKDIAKANIELEKSLKSLHAITGVTDAQFKNFEKQIDAVSKKQKVFAGDTAKAFEVVGSAKPELLGNAEALSKVTDSVITLSKASGDELAPTAQYLTGVLNQFMLSAEYSEQAMNVLAAASVVGDTKIGQTAEAFKVAGSEAHMSGLNIEEMAGSIALMSKFGYKGADAGTKFRNVLSKMASGEALPKDAIRRLKAAGVDIDLISDKSVSFIKRLREISKISGDAAAMTKVFGIENKAVASIMLQNIDLLEQNIKGVTGTTAATDMAAKKTDTLQNKWKEIVATFRNAVTTTNSQNKAFTMLKKGMDFVINNMDTILAVTGLLIGAFVVFKATMFTINAVMKAYSIATKIVTAAQWAWNAAMSANPIGAIISAIVILIGLVVLVIAKYNEWGAAFSFLAGSAMPLIHIIMSFRRNWDMITKAFREGGVLAGIKAIGATLLDAVLFPLQQILELIGRIPGADKIIAPALEKMQEFREKLGVNMETGNENPDIINPQKTQNLITQQLITEQNSNATLNIEDQTGTAKIKENNGMNINLSNTFGF